jgi:hypothetical protein
MATQVGKCPNCHTINAYSKSTCLECNTRLPWADVVETAEANARAAQEAREKQVEAQQNAQRAAPGASLYTNRQPKVAGAAGYCPKCGKSHYGSGPICLHCGSALYSGVGQSSNANSNDGPSFGAAFIGFLLPIGGVLIWALQKDNYPERAASAGRGALCGLFVGTLIGIFGYIGVLNEVTGITPSSSGDTSQVVTSPTEEKDRYEQMVKDDLNRDFITEGLSISCTEVHLVKESQTRYTGFAELSNGRKRDVELVSDGDEVIWKVR